MTAAQMEIISIPRHILSVTSTSGCAANLDVQVTGPSENAYAFVFKNIPKPLEVKKMIIAGAFPECVLVNAALLVDVAQLSSSLVRSITGIAEGSARTKTLYSEVLYNLSPLTNVGDWIRISESMKIFGASEKLRNAVVIFVGEKHPSPEDIQKLCDAMQGEPGSLEELPSFTDWVQVERVFKLEDRKDALSLILGAMALKGHL